MPHDRFFSDSTFEKEISLEGQELHHLTRVMRVKVGDTVELINGKGALATARVENIGKRVANLIVVSLHNEEKPTQSLILAQALCRLNRLDHIVEKATELGMTELWLFPTEGSEKKQLSETQMQRLRTLSISAIKQSGRLYLPEIKYYSSIEKCPFKGKKCFFGDPEGSFLNEVESQNNVFCIGPEKGFTEKETLWFRNNQFKGAKLNENILRTDTAAIISIALLNYFAISR